MPTNILMPALSPTMEKGNLAKWLKKEGDPVRSGDVLAEIETDKATMEVEAVDEGVLARIVVPDGTADVAVNEVIGVIAEEGEEVGDAGAQPQAAKPAAAPKPEPEPTAAVPQPAAKPTPAATKPAAMSEPDPDGPVVQAAAGERGYGVVPGQTVVQTGVEAQPSGVNGSGSRVLSSPLARRLAREGGIELGTIQGSGPHGRIVERDVKAALAAGPAAKGQPAAPQPPASAQPQPAPQAKPAVPSDDMVRRLFPAGSFEEVPHDTMRRTIARRLVEAKQTVPHFYLSVDCDIDALLALREQVNQAAPRDREGKPAYKVSVNDLVIKAYALALRAVPDANVSWTEGAMLKHRHADIGVAVSIPGGLITPVVREADVKSLSAISNEMKDLAARARNRKLKPEEYQGGTGAVSNLGMFGIKSFSAVINPPHATILAVGAGEPRPVVKGGQLGIATLMSVTLSTDHRAVDGALGAELMQAIKGYIEKPIGMLV